MTQAFINLHLKDASKLWKEQSFKTIKRKSIMIINTTGPKERSWSLPKMRGK
jgi:hypothetical protein